MNAFPSFHPISREALMEPMQEAQTPPAVSNGPTLLNGTLVNGSQANGMRGPTFPGPKKLKDKHWYILRISAFLLLLPFAHFYGCFATDADRTQAQQVVSVIHSQLGHGDFDGIYDNADKSLRDEVTRDRHVALFSYIVKRYGTPSDCAVSDTAVRFGFGTKMIQSECTSKWSGGLTLVETFRFKKSDDEYRLYYFRYRIKP